MAMQGMLLQPETRIKTTEENALVTDWNPEARKKCKWGVDGKIVTHHDSHGLYYEVEHDDGSRAVYDPFEIEVLP